MTRQKESNTFRFAVGTRQSIESWIWRMWVHGDEVYIGARDALHCFKVSLHNSGIWRIAQVAELERADKESDRVIVKWNRPVEFALGWTASIGIMVSSIQPRRPFRPAPIDDARITWFDAPKEGRKLMFKILFSSARFSERELRCVCLEHDRLATCLAKKNGERVWLVVREGELSSVEIQKFRDVMAKTKIHLNPGSPEDVVNGSRALLVVSPDQPAASTQPTLLDISLGRENLVCA